MSTSVDSASSSTSESTPSSSPLPDSIRSGIHHFYDSTPEPSSLTTFETKLTTFLSQLPHTSSRLVALTSGGTLVPFEQRMVRFLDNFSTGLRGAALAERFLQHGYYVIFLHRSGSALPFVRRLAMLLNGSSSSSSSSGGGLNTIATLDALRVNKDGSGLTIDLPASSSSSSSSSLLTSLSSFTNTYRSHFLSLEFQSITEYLFQLRTLCFHLRRFEHRSMLLLAAAVSDYYIPFQEMSLHKLDSRSGGDGLELKMSPTPKVLHALRHEIGERVSNGDNNDTTSSSSSPSPFSTAWLPSSFICSFKLETNPDILLKKASKALITYRFNGVLANQLETRYKEMKIVTPSTAVASGSESSVNVELVERGEKKEDDAAAVGVDEDGEFGIELEVNLVKRLIQLHQQWIEHK